MHDQSIRRHGTARSQRLPRNQQRERVLRLVGAANGAVDAAELAERMNLHVTTVRFHLDALCEDGAVARTRIKRDGVGRPRTGYVAVRDRLDYRSLAEILAMELGETAAERQECAERAGERWAERILASDNGVAEGPATRNGSTPDAGIDECADRIAGIFARMGFGAELTTPADGAEGQRTILLHSCPVREMARAHPEVSCAMHRGLLRGLLNAENGPGGTAELEPFVEPEMCIARVAGR
ncbi:transcriptional regulator [Mycolicibacter nonchromogenicus]|uniref:Transcriptional regulator n=1 Tax=Mycolicibacter nonchromogenicus TaxID=1782 RepID=A0A1X1Z3M4_MYCNO|nr:transcriptional regulator [Mycolicibacter nonchromogenicus]ORW17983.1 transcriptional regulator [Mycolicibacter nonchromogenicus]